MVREDERAVHAHLHLVEVRVEVRGLAQEHLVFAVRVPFDCVEAGVSRVGCGGSVRRRYARCAGTESAHWLREESNSATTRCCWSPSSPGACDLRMAYCRCQRGLLSIIVTAAKAGILTIVRVA